MVRPQKTFSLSDVVTREFEEFCLKNGYSQVTTFIAGYLALRDMDHVQRAPLMYKAAIMLGTQKAERAAESAAERAARLATRKKRRKKQGA